MTQASTLWVSYVWSLSFSIYQYKLFSFWTNVCLCTCICPLDLIPCVVCSLQTYYFLPSYSSPWYPRHVLISLTTYTEETVWSAVPLTCFLVVITAARYQPSLIFLQLSEYTFPLAFASVLFDINIKFLFLCVQQLRGCSCRKYSLLYFWFWCNSLNIQMTMNNRSHRKYGFVRVVIMLLHFITYLIFVSESAII